MRNLHLPGRSVARSRNAMAATSHPLATHAALEIMKHAGGNAVDAAIAAAAVQAVVEPQSTGIGGDCFALVAPNGGSKVHAFNGSGWSPKAASIEAFRAAGVGDAINNTNVHAVTVPGAVDAWQQIQQKFGRLSFKEVLAPAIQHAEQGFVVGDRVAFDWDNARATLAANPAGSQAYLDAGQAPKAGRVWVLPKLAETLKVLAAEGARAFYEGPLMQQMVQSLNDLGGLHQEADFSEFSGGFVEPIKLSYRGYDIWECPPNGQGIIALMILNIMQHLETLGSGPRAANRLHLEAEAARLAYSVRDRFVTDPNHRNAGLVDWMLSDELAKQLAGEIDPQARNETISDIQPSLHKDTVYLCVVDEDRNCVSFINSLFHSFGSGIMCPSTGVLFQNRGMAFSMDPDRANAVAGRKRPLHTIIPGMVTQGERAVAPFGVMGGQYQALGHAHLLSGLLDFGLDVQEALDMPRVMFGEGKDLDIEDGTGQQVRDGLARRGHRLTRPETPIGGGQIIWIDEQGNLSGGSDPRKDGLALGY